MQDIYIGLLLKHSYCQSYLCFYYLFLFLFMFELLEVA